MQMVVHPYVLLQTLPYLGKLRNRENFNTQKFRLYPINIYNKTFKMENFCALPTTSSPIIVLIMKQEIVQWLNIHG